jgi:hypothetical protein
MAEHSHKNRTDQPAPAAPSSNAVDGADDARHRISLVKGNERWQFRWDPGNESVLINRIAELARDPAIPFDWFDAAVICKHIAQPFKT